MALSQAGRFTFENAKAEAAAAVAQAVPEAEDAPAGELAVAAGEEVPEPSASAPAASPPPAVPRRASPVNPATETG